VLLLPIFCVTDPLIGDKSDLMTTVHCVGPVLARGFVSSIHLYTTALLAVPANKCNVCILVS
jgi:hypothetical protein